MPWPVLPDAQVAAESPAGNWVPRKLRDRDRRGITLIQGDGVLHHVDLVGISASLAWTTYATMRVILPPSYVGDNGYKLAVMVTVHVAGSIGAFNTNAKLLAANVRLKLGTTYSNVVSATLNPVITGSDPLDQPTVTGTLVLTTGLTSGAVSAVELQMEIPNNRWITSSGEFTWLAGLRHFFCAMPR